MYEQQRAWGDEPQPQQRVSSNQRPAPRRGGAKSVKGRRPEKKDKRKVEI